MVEPAGKEQFEPVQRQADKKQTCISDLRMPVLNMTHIVQIILIRQLKNQFFYSPSLGSSQLSIVGESADKVCTYSVSLTAENYAKDSAQRKNSRSIPPGR